jgi:hypothetical protein
LWLVPDEPSGKTMTIRANSGMEFPKSEHAPDPAAFRRRLCIRPDTRAAELQPAGTADRSGLLRFEVADAGVYVVAVETQPKLITLDAPQFNEYLVADGLPHIYRLRAREKTLDQPGRERYSKSPKAIVRIGEGGGDACRVLGLPLEIVPRRDPFQLATGDTLPVRVLFQGRPLADAPLGWTSPGDGESPRGTVRTDEAGDALIPIGRLGLMTIRLTHMTRPKTAEYEWESFWTTLTFRIPHTVGAVGPGPDRAPPTARPESPAAGAAEHAGLSPFVPRKQPLVPTGSPGRQTAALQNSLV